VLPANDFRAHAPRFTGPNRERNLALVERLRELAEQLGATPAQLAIAWVLARGEDVIPLIGARSRERLDEALAATELRLGPAQMDALERAIPSDAVAGDRYPAPQMAMLDSEQR
jgi:aryl-alcohol dehydrogenase-like predicted oxidoreductase